MSTSGNIHKINHTIPRGKLYRLLKILLVTLWSFDGYFRQQSQPNSQDNKIT